MATTKKVARKKVTRKKTVKKVTGPLKSAKKTVKKTAKKAVAKTVAKKGTSTGRTRAQRTSFDEKLATVEALHSKAKSETTSTSPLPSKNRLKKPVLRDRLTLSVLSPQRFPINIDALAIQTARIGGVAFVLLGGLFALNFSQYVFTDSSVLTQHARTMTAQLCDPVTMSTLQYNSCIAQQTLDEQADTASESLASSSESAAEALEPPAPTDPSILSIDNTQPTVTFDFGQNAPLSGLLPINVNVDGADAVEVLIYKDSWNGFEASHEADYVGNNNWTYNWDTTEHEDANYLIKARVFNVYEANGYIQDHSSYLEVQNTEVAATTTPDLDTTPDAIVTLKTPEPVANTAKIEVQVPDAKEVRFSVTDGLGSVSHLSGEATRSTAGSNLWWYTWDTSGYANGTYTVRAHVKNSNSGNRYNAGSVTVLVTHLEVVDQTLVDQPDDTTIVPDDTEEPAVEPPEVKLSFRDGAKLSGLVEMYIDTDRAQNVSVYAISAGSATEKYLGTAFKVSPKRWILRYFSKQLPNGDYDIYAKVTNAYGTYTGEKKKVQVENISPFYTNPQKETEITKAVSEVKTIEQEVAVAEVSEVDDKNIEESESKELSIAEIQERRVDAIVATFSQRIDEELQRFASAYRSGNKDRIALAQNRIDHLKEEIGTRVAAEEDKIELISKINVRIDETLTRYTQSIDQVDTLIAQRVKTDVFKDSDKDGISDYDEVSIYNTNPLVADTDGDGFIDGAEVESGYDPTDAKREVAITYESPKEKGVVRSDMLKIKSIDTITEDVADPTAETPTLHAVITGTALPNSYATIYIFSTPIVVTVKTDEDGAWRYRFDKELENGEHNVYVGVTDNAGKIVAKSEPFAFIKEAQAFTAVDSAVIGSAEIVDSGDDSSLLSQYMVYLIVSISVVSIGLVLILLGLHLDTRGRRYPEVVTDQQ